MYQNMTWLRWEMYLGNEKKYSDIISNEFNNNQGVYSKKDK
jgi:hypothetical protein